MYNLQMEMEFIKDFVDGVSAKKLKSKYSLSNLSYNKLKKKYCLKRTDWEKTSYPYQHKPAKNYSRNNNGGYNITKYVDGKNTYFCHTDTEEKAVRIVKKLRDCGWDKTELYRVLYEVEKEFERGGA